MLILLPKTGVSVLGGRQFEVEVRLSGDDDISAGRALATGIIFLVIIIVCCVGYCMFCCCCLLRCLQCIRKIC